MRKILLMLPLAAAAAFATSAAAQPQQYDPYVGTDPSVGTYAPVAGAVAGSLFGLSLSEAWWGSSIAGYALPASAATASVVGGVAGIGTLTLIHGLTTPCQGAHAFWSGLFTSPEGCENGRWVGYGPRGRAPRR